MSRKIKLLNRFLSRPKDFTYEELKTLLTFLGYKESNKGATSGSRVCFVNEELPSIIYLHKPHNPDIVKQYQIKEILEELTTHKLL